MKTNYGFFTRALSMASIARNSDWDGSGALEISDSAWAGVFSLYMLIPKEIQEPQILPTSDGNIQLFWDNNEFSFEVEIDQFNKMNCIFNDKIDETKLIKELVIIEDTLPNDFIACLSYFKE